MALPNEVNVGTAPNNKTGDPLRTGGQKINANFVYLEENKQDISDKGAANGYVGLNANVKIGNEYIQMPVIPVETVPATGEENVLYTESSTANLKVWNGTDYDIYGGGSITYQDVVDALGFVPEPDLGNPVSNDMVLASDTAGNRYWVVQESSGGGVTQQYVDDADAATLASANSYTDTKTENVSKTIGTLIELREYEGSTNEAVNVLGRGKKGDGLIAPFPFIWDDDSEEADNDATIIQVTGVAVGRWKVEIQGAVNVKWFGAKGDGITDDYNAINQAFFLLSQTSEASNGNTFIGFQGALLFPKGTYLISQSLIKSLTYGNIRGDDAIIEPHVDFDLTNYAFDFEKWQGSINSLQFNGFNFHLKLHNANLDQGLFNLNDCRFFGGDTAISLEAQSSIVNIKGCKFDAVKHVLDQITCDRVVFQNCWVTQGELNTDYDATFIKQAGGLFMRDCLFVPRVGTGIKTSWIRNNGGLSLVVDNVRFGAESGGKTIINNFVQGDTTAPLTPATVQIINCTELYSSSSPIVRLFYLPNGVVLDNNAGFAGTNAIIDFDEDFTTIDDEKLRIGSQFEIRTSNLDKSKYTPVFMRAVLHYFNNHSFTKSHGFLSGVTNTTAKELIFLKNRSLSNLIQSGGALSIRLKTDTDNFGTSSSYIIESNVAGTAFNIIPLYEGVNPSAPILINDNETIKAKVLSITTSQNIFYEIEYTDMQYILTR